MEKVATLDRKYGKDASITPEQAIGFAKRLPAFGKWVEKLASNYGDNLTKIDVLEVYPFGPVDKARGGFVMANVTATYNNKPVSGFAFIRGGAVSILVIAQDPATKEEYVVTVRQPRVPGGEVAYEEIPAGMLDDAKNVAGVAVKEIEEELKFKIDGTKLVKLSEMYPSIGGSDEMITTYVYRTAMPYEQIKEFIGKETGAAEENEQIITVVRKYDDFKQACRDGGITDAKAQLSLGLYEMLKAEKGPDAVPLVTSGGGSKRTRKSRSKRMTRKFKTSTR
jgi:hypothetical protein